MAASAYVIATQKFFRFFGRSYEVDVRITETQIKPRVTKKKYEFSTEELQKILSIATIRDKALILLGATAGWGAGDISILEKKTIEQILNDSKGHYFWFTKRVKTNSDQYLCLTPETREVLKSYVETLSTNEVWLFPGYNSKEEDHLQPQRLYSILKHLCEKAHIESKNPKLQPLRFHGLRQYFSRKYRGRPEVKEFCMGHAPRYAGAYSVSEDEIWQDFQEQEVNLRIQLTAPVPARKEDVEKQNQEIESLRTELATLKTQVRKILLTGVVPVQRASEKRLLEIYKDELAKGVILAKFVPPKKHGKLKQKETS
jgi:hypothetical protein